MLEVTPEKVSELFDRFKDVSWENLVYTIDSWKPWKTVTFVALTHGNEVSGLYVFDHLLNELNIWENLLSWKLHLVVWNHHAHLEKDDLNPYWKRFLDMDFNRVWDNSWETKTYERKDEILKYVEEADILLDIHSTSLPSDSMLIPATSNEETWELSDKMEADYVLFNIIDKLNGRCLAMHNAVMKEESVSFVLEWGQHFDGESVKKAVKNALVILEHAEMYDLILDKGSNEKKMLDIYHCHYADHLDINYKYSDNPTSFDYIEKWELIAETPNGKIIMPEDGYIVMPTIKLSKLGEEVLYLAREI